MGSISLIILLVRGCSLITIDHSSPSSIRVEEPRNYKHAASLYFDPSGVILKLGVVERAARVDDAIASAPMAG